MTLEELRNEAKKQGYTLIKSKPYIPHVKCSCGRRANLWQKFDINTDREYFKIECRRCGKKSEWFTTKYDAWAEWFERNTQNDTERIDTER